MTRATIVEYATREEFYKCLPEGGIGAEIGVAHGYNSMRIWQMAKPKKLHLIDWWTTFPDPQKVAEWTGYKAEVERQFSQQIKEGNVVLHEGNFINIIPAFENNYFDFVYIDGLHDYDNVKRDINMSVNKVKIGGIVAGHDFNSVYYPDYPHVARAVIEAVQAGLGPMIALSRESDFAIRMERRITI
jgi:predicted O-methyltransferase YrrM